MGCTNCEDHALIHRQLAGKKMNVLVGKYKDKTKWGNCQKQFVLVVGSCVHFWSSKVHSSMNANMQLRNYKK